MVSQWILHMPLLCISCIYAVAIALILDGTLYSRMEFRWQECQDIAAEKLLVTESIFKFAKPYRNNINFYYDWFDYQVNHRYMRLFRCKFQLCLIKLV